VSNDEAADEQARADKDDNGERDFGDNDHAADATAA
jgi:hypothetical protein